MNLPSRQGSPPRSLLLGVIAVSAILFPGRARPAEPPVPSEPPVLTLRQARDEALRSHPAISAADLRALAAVALTRQVRAPQFPSLSANAVAVGTADDNTRLAAVGALNNPAIYDRSAEGLVFSQLLTDFGRTPNLAAGARLQSEAESDRARAIRAGILLAVDAAFYSALKAQAVARVTHQTVTARDTLLEQVRVMATNQLRSELEVSFARVALEEGRLLDSRAESDIEAAFTRLSTLLGQREPRTWVLREEEPADDPAPGEITQLIRQALDARPDLAVFRHQQQAAVRLARGEEPWRHATLSMVGSAGVAPVHDPALPDHYAAAGLVLNVPILSGGLNAARHRESLFRAEAAEAALQDAENSAVRDLRIAWLQERNARDRQQITAQLVRNARESFELARSRYLNGLSSVVEFNQAELNLLSAEITHTTTVSEYRIARSTLAYEAGQLH